MTDAMDVGRAEAERRTRLIRPGNRRTAECEPILGDRPRDDGDGAAGEIVVVEAGVVLVHPADQPDRDLVVALQLDVDPLLARVPDETLPAPGVGGEVEDELLEVHRKRSGLTTVIACCAAGPSSDRLAGATTGRSVPYRSRSTPTTRSIASIARGP